MLSKEGLGCISHLGIKKVVCLFNGFPGHTLGRDELKAHGNIGPVEQGTDLGIDFAHPIDGFGQSRQFFVIPGKQEDRLVDLELDFVAPGRDGNRMAFFRHEPGDPGCQAKFFRVLSWILFWPLASSFFRAALEITSMSWACLVLETLTTPS